MGEIMVVLKGGGYQKITPRSVFVLSSGYAHLVDGLKFVYAMVALPSERKYDVITPAPNRELEPRNLKQLRRSIQQLGRISRMPWED